MSRYGPHGAPPKRRKAPEKLVQQKTKLLLRACGIAVWDTSQPFHPLITPGVPDLICVAAATVKYDLPARTFFVECKAEGGKLNGAQRSFKAVADDAGTPVIVGGWDEVETQLVQWGYMDRQPDERRAIVRSGLTQTWDRYPSPPF